MRRLLENGSDEGLPVLGIRLFLGGGVLSIAQYGKDII